MSKEDCSEVIDSIFSNGLFYIHEENEDEVRYYYECKDKSTKIVFQNALAGMIVSNCMPEIRDDSFPFTIFMVRHILLMAILRQSIDLKDKPLETSMCGMDTRVMVDAIVYIIGHQEKVLARPAVFVVGCMLDMAVTLLETREKACNLMLFRYMSEKICQLCYDRAWYTKLGGCMVIDFFCGHMSLKFLLQHQYRYVKSLFFTMMDLTGEVSSGTLDLAKNTLVRMLKICFCRLDDQHLHLAHIQKKSLNEVTKELVRQVTSPNEMVRKQAQSSLMLIAHHTNRSVCAIMTPHREILSEIIPPKKHLLRYQPANAQIGLMDGNTFCTSLEPRLFTLDITTVEHKVFFTELLGLCEADDSQLQKLACYKVVNNLTRLRKTALKALGACYYITMARERIFKVIFKALNSDKKDIQNTAMDVLKLIHKTYGGMKLDIDNVLVIIRPLFLSLANYHKFNANVVKVFTGISFLFPQIYCDKIQVQMIELINSPSASGGICALLISHLKNWVACAITNENTYSDNGRVITNDVLLCADIMNIFHLVPIATYKLIEPLTDILIQAESELLIEISAPLLAPLIRFLCRYKLETIEIFLSQVKLRVYTWNRLFRSILLHNESSDFLTLMKSYLSQLMDMLLDQCQLPHPNASFHQPSFRQNPNVFNQCLQLVHMLSENYPRWIGSVDRIHIEHLVLVWTSDVFQRRHRQSMGTMEINEYEHWKEPRMLVEIILAYFKCNPGEYGFLFELMVCFNARYMAQFQFLKDYLDNEVTKNFSVQWKRGAYFSFVTVYMDNKFNNKTKAKILQYIIQPSFVNCFSKNEHCELIGGPPDPENNDVQNNIISNFINVVIDPDKEGGDCDAIRILLLQLSSHLVEHAHHHIHDVQNKQGKKLRRLMTYAWPCLLAKNCIDPITKYHGHLLLSHIIAKFAIHKRIVLQVFHSLLKAHPVEPRAVVRAALDILTPAMPDRMEDGNTMLVHWSRKIIMEDGHTLSQLVHILTLIVKHFKVYFPVRHSIINLLNNSIHRLGYTPSATTEHRKLSVDLAEVIIKWDIMLRRRDSFNIPFPDPNDSTVTEPPNSYSLLPIASEHNSHVVNFLLRIACQVNEPQNSSSSTTGPGELLSRHCVVLCKIALDRWPESDLKLTWIEKLLTTVEGHTPNISNIVTALELLNYLLTIMKKDVILVSLKPLQRGIAANMSCPNSKIIRAVHSLLSRLMSLFPTEPTSSNVASKHEELEQLYACVSKVIYEGLAKYEKLDQGSSNCTPPQLFGTLMILKAACMHNTGYIDRLITSFMRVLQRIAREHLNTPNSEPISEMLILSLDLVKSRVSIMAPDMRKGFIGGILVGLIEKSSDVKIIRAITRMCEDWVKGKVQQNTANQSPSLREKSILMCKLMSHVEKRFSDDTELNTQFLELVDYIYREGSLANTELTNKLEPAFLSGLRCHLPILRARFTTTFHMNVKRQIGHRLEYVVSTQNWETMGVHYWIKQALDMIITGSSRTSLIQSKVTRTRNASLVPLKNLYQKPINHSTDICMMQIVEDDKLVTEMSSYRRSFDFYMSPAQQKAADDLMYNNDHELPVGKTTPSDPLTSSRRLLTTMYPEGVQPTSLATMAKMHSTFIEICHETKTLEFMKAVAEISHSNTNLAHDLWVQLFPSVFRSMDNIKQATLMKQIDYFLSSGSHLIQKDVHPSGVHTFFDGVTRCSPPMYISPSIIKYLGHTHNMWHRSMFALEQSILDNEYLQNLHSPTDTSSDPIAITSLDDSKPSDCDYIDEEQMESISCLGKLYDLVCEDDYSAALWRTRSRFRETRLAITLEQHGRYGPAIHSYKEAIQRAALLLEHPNKLKPSDYEEFYLWDSKFIKCAKELNQWDMVLKTSVVKAPHYNMMILDTAWHNKEWTVMKDSMAKVELSCPKEYAWKVNLYRGYLAICHPEERHLNMIDRLVEVSTNLAVKEWRRLPHIVSNIHVPLLQAAQQIMELSEASQIASGLQSNSIGRDSPIHDMKAIVKTWKNRLPVVADDLSHWSDVFKWREHHYDMIVARYDLLQIGNTSTEAGKLLQNSSSSTATSTTSSPGGQIMQKHIFGSMQQPAPQQQTSPVVKSKNSAINGNVSTLPANKIQTTNIQSNPRKNSLLGVHSLAQSITVFSKMCRKQESIQVCLRELSRIHDIPSVPIVDCFQKIRQQMKCYITMAGNMQRHEYFDGLDIIQSTNLKYFTKDMTAEFHALKGNFLSLIGYPEEANKAFSSAIQLHDTQIKAWGSWGDHLERSFVGMKDKDMVMGGNAMTCFLHACRHTQESKARKYIAKSLFLLTFTDPEFKMAAIIEKYATTIPTLHWLPWIPQLLMCLVRDEGIHILNLLSKLGSQYPQAVYFPIRTLYLTLKIEQRERYKNTIKEASIQFANKNGKMIKSDVSKTTCNSSSAASAAYTSTTSITSTTSTTSTTITGSSISNTPAISNINAVQPPAHPVITTIRPKVQTPSPIKLSPSSVITGQVVKKLTPSVNLSGALTSNKTIVAMKTVPSKMLSTVSMLSSASNGGPPAKKALVAKTASSPGKLMPIVRPAATTTAAPPGGVVGNPTIPRGQSKQPPAIITVSGSKVVTRVTPITVIMNPTTNTASSTTPATPATPSTTPATTTAAASRLMPTNPAGITRTVTAYSRPAPVSTGLRPAKVAKQIVVSSHKTTGVVRLTGVSNPASVRPIRPVVPRPSSSVRGLSPSTPSTPVVIVAPQGPGNAPSVTTAAATAVRPTTSSRLVAPIRGAKLVNNSTADGPTASHISSSSSSSSSRTSACVQQPHTAANNTTTTTNTSAAPATPASAARPGQEGPIRATAPMWRCSRIMHTQRDLHPTILSSLEGIVDQMVWFRENWYEEVYRQLRQALTKCYEVAFSNREDINNALCTQHQLNFVNKLVTTFGVGIENIPGNLSTNFASGASESIARRAALTSRDPIFQKTKKRFTIDFDFKEQKTVKLSAMINKIRKWVNILEAKIETLDTKFLIEDKCRFLSNFSINTAEVEIPGEFLIPKHTHYYVKIVRFMPIVDIVHKHNTAARRLRIRGHNGKEYPYLVVNDACLTESRREERVLQLLRMNNQYLDKQKETAKRLLQFNVARVVAVSPQTRLVEDNCTSLSLYDIFTKHCKDRKLMPLDVLKLYYEYLSTAQIDLPPPKPNQYYDYKLTMQNVYSDISKSHAPPNILKDFIHMSFNSASDLWTFRKNFATQLAVMNWAQYTYHLTNCNADMFYMHRDSGLINISYFKFDIDCQNSTMESKNIVPFRLTPNITFFLNELGINGPYSASMVACARATMVSRDKAKSYLRTILKDEFICIHKKKQEEECPTIEPSEMNAGNLVKYINNAVKAVINRNRSMSIIDHSTGEVAVTALIDEAMNLNNLLSIDPIFLPWL